MLLMTILTLLRLIMAFKIITVDERLKEQSGIKMIVVGPYGIGKTSLLKTLDKPMLCIDLEAGLLAVQDWQGATISVRTWPEARDLGLHIEMIFQWDPFSLFDRRTESCFAL
jgi:ABC-type polar amino acid transport system ATPase subunit